MNFFKIIAGISRSIQKDNNIFTLLHIAAFYDASCKTQSKFYCFVSISAAGPILLILSRKNTKKEVLVG